MRRVKAEIVYVDLEGGFWGLSSDEGEQFKPINFPEQLKMKGSQVHIWIRELDMMGFSMWGIPVRIEGYDLE